MLKMATFLRRNKLILNSMKNVCNLNVTSMRNISTIMSTDNQLSNLNSKIIPIIPISGYFTGRKLGLFYSPEVAEDVTETEGAAEETTEPEAVVETEGVPPAEE